MPDPIFHPLTFHQCLPYPTPSLQNLPPFPHFLLYLLPWPALPFNLRLRSSLPAFTYFFSRACSEQYGLTSPPLTLHHPINITSPSNNILSGNKSPPATSSSTPTYWLAPDKLFGQHNPKFTVSFPCVCVLMSCPQRGVFNEPASY